MNLTKQFKQFFGLSVLTLSIGGLLTWGGAYGAQCKGLSMSKCESATDCSWVKSYTTSKGAKVNAYCRAKPSKSGKKSSTGDTTSTITKDTKKEATTANTSEKSEKGLDKKKTKTKSSTGSNKKDSKKSTSKSEKKDKKKAASKSEKTTKKTDKK